MHLDEWRLTINAKRRNMKTYHRAHTGGSEKVQLAIDITNLVSRLPRWTEKCYYFACGILKLQGDRGLIQARSVVNASHLQQCLCRLWTVSIDMRVHQAP